VGAYSGNAPLEGHHPALRALSEVNLWQKIIKVICPCDITVEVSQEESGHFTFQNTPPFAEEKFFWIRCPPNALEIFSW
jgi:hypothetical protein